MLEAAVMCALAALVCALFLVCRSTHRLAERVGDVVAKAGGLIEAFGNAQAKVSELMSKQDEFTLGAMWKFHERAWTFSVNKELNSFVHAKGLLPFVADPGSMVQKEIAEIQKNLGCSREDAIGWMRSRFTPEGVAANGNME